MVVLFSQGVYTVTTAASGVDQGGQAVVVDVTAYAFDVDDAGIAIAMIETELLNEPIIPDGAGGLRRPKQVTAVTVGPGPLAVSPFLFKREASGAKNKASDQQHSRNSSDCIVDVGSRLDHSQRLCAEHVLVRGYRPREKRRSGDVYRSRSVWTTRPDDHSRQGDGHERETCLLGRRSLEADHSQELSDRQRDTVRARETRSEVRNDRSAELLFEASEHVTDNLVVRHLCGCRGQGLALWYKRPSCSSTRAKRMRSTASPPSCDRRALRALAVGTGSVINAPLALIGVAESPDTVTRHV